MTEIDEERKNRIYFEIIVDAHDQEEQNMGWHYYMEETLKFPFKAEVKIKKRNKTEFIQKVDVLELSSNECFKNDMKVGVSYNEDVFDVPLLSLTNIEADEKSIEAIEDWKYWNK